MVYDFKDKIALVTGGANGIGLQYCKQLLKNGIKGISVLDYNQVAGENAQRELGPKTIFIKADVTKEQEFEDAFKKTVATFGRLDLVINNAGIFCDERWEQEISTNVTALTRGILLGFKYMGKDTGANGGIIVNTASLAGLTDAVAAAPVYTSTKHFAVCMGRSMGSPFYYKLTGVKILTICPGGTDTDLFANFKPLLGFDGIMKIKEKMFQINIQKPEKVGECLIDVLNKGENGSVWQISVELDESVEVLPLRRLLYYDD